MPLKSRAQRRNSQSFCLKAKYRIKYLKNGRGTCEGQGSRKSKDKKRESRTKITQTKQAALAARRRGQAFDRVPKNPLASGHVRRAFRWVLCDSIVSV